MTRTAAILDRFLTVRQLIERRPIGRTMVYQLIKSPDFPKALVLLRDCHGQPRSTGFLEADIIAYEERHMVHASEFDLPDEDDDLGSDLPPAKRTQPGRGAR